MGFDPASLALAAGIGGAVVGGIGQIQSGQAVANAANYSAQVATNNATIAGQNADYAIKAGEEQAVTQSLKGAATAGKVKANQAASGIDVNSGSAVNVQQSQREQEKLDTETVLHNAQLAAYGYRTQQTGFQAQAGLDTLQAQQAPVGADLSAAGGLLNSASGLSLKWAQYGNKGGSGGGDSNPTDVGSATGFGVS